MDVVAVTVLEVPANDPAQPWPTLGPAVCEWIEANLVHGPGDLRGLPVTLGPEQRFAVYRAYEVHPHDSPTPGRRRFNRVSLSWRKGTAKTEFAALLAAAELHPDAPVRFAGWSPYRGEPEGRAVTDPYIPMVAYTEEQSDELAYGALMAILRESPVAGDFSIGLERIDRARNTGRAVSLAGSPNARDGARTTFSVKDETHRWDSERLTRAHRTMLENLAKRPIADPWELEVTTAYAPGANSVAEQTRGYAERIAAGDIEDPRLWYFHRQANPDTDITTPAGLRAAIVEASGSAAAWSDIERIASAWDDPNADHAYLERVWLNRPVQSSLSPWSESQWDGAAYPDLQIDAGAAVALGLSGSREGGTALVACDVATGLLQLAGCWERPASASDAWEIDPHEVSAAVRAAFDLWSVQRMYQRAGDWDSWGADWASEFGSEVVVEPIKPNHIQRNGWACHTFDVALRSEELAHRGEPAMRRHVLAAQKRESRVLGEGDRYLWTLEPPLVTGVDTRIDAAWAAVLAFRARVDYIRYRDEKAAQVPSLTV